MPEETPTPAGSSRAAAGYSYPGDLALFVPAENGGEPSREHPYIDLRYPFADGPARLGFPDLIVDILNRLAQLHGTADHEQPPGVVGWEEFEATPTPICGSSICRYMPPGSTR